MNEQPGHLGKPGELVRPVVGRPVSAATPPHKTPFNAKHMPLGVSANTMNVASHIRLAQIRRLLFLGVPMAILLAVVVAVWLAARSLSPLGPKVISNGIYEYHFTFYKAAEPVNLEQGEGLQDSNRALVIAKPTSDRLFGDCSEVGNGWRKAFGVVVEGREQQACTLDNKLYLVIFTHNDRRHLFEINYATTQKGKNDEIRAIMESLKVTVP